MGRIRNKEISAALYKKIAPLLPVMTPSAKGGRPLSKSTKSASEIHEIR